MSEAHVDVLAIARDAPDGSDPIEQSTTSPETSFEVEKEKKRSGAVADESNTLNGHSRLNCFLFITQSETSSKDDETTSDSDLSQNRTNDSVCQFTRASSFTEKHGREMDFETWSQDSFEACE